MQKHKAEEIAEIKAEESGQKAEPTAKDTKQPETKPTDTTTPAKKPLLNSLKEYIKNKAKK